jgi:hypothetical protein
VAYGEAMATWADVERLAMAMPQAAARDSGQGHREWRVRDKLFAWERPLRKGDLEALGDDAPTGDILAVRTPDEGGKFALVADAPDIYFTTPHFNGYPAVLIKLDRIPVDELREAIVESWLTQVTKRMAADFRSSYDAL